MTEPLILHSFGVHDRSGKVRWTAAELGIPVEERRYRPGEHRQPPYTDLNPFGMVPTVEYGGSPRIESTATMTWLAEQHPDAGLVVAPDEPDRFDYLQWMALFAETLESRLVEYRLASVDYIPAAYKETTEARLRRQLPLVVEQLPDGFLVAGRFTLADVVAAYSLRLAVKSGLLSFDDVAGYLRPLMERPAAQQARLFEALAGL